MPHQLAGEIHAQQRVWDEGQDDRSWPCRRRRNRQRCRLCSWQYAGGRRSGSRHRYSCRRIAGSSAAVGARVAALQPDNSIRPRSETWRWASPSGSPLASSWVLPCPSVPARCAAPGTAWAWCQPAHMDSLGACMNGAVVLVNYRSLPVARGPSLQGCRKSRSGILSAVPDNAVKPRRGVT